MPCSVLTPLMTMIFLVMIMKAVFFLIKQLGSVMSTCDVIQTKDA